MIHFGEINKKIIYPIIPIIITIFEYCYSTRHYHNLYTTHVLVFKICQALSMFLAIIPFIIIKKKSHVRYSKNLNSENLYSKEYNEKMRKTKIRKYILIPMTAIITYLYKIIYYLKFHEIGTFLSLWIFDLIFICIFSYLILKTKYYRHQYFSIITMIFFGIILNIINTLSGLTFKKFILFLVMNMLYSFNITIKKYIIDYTFCYASELLMYDGLITLVLFIITIIITTYKEMKMDICEYALYKGKCYFDNIYSYYDSLNTKEVFIFIFILFYYTLYHLFFYVTMKEFSAFHIFLIIIFEDDILYDIIFKYNSTKKNNIWKLYANIIIFSILFFMLLVFTEIIEIDCFKMSENTKRNITKRSGYIDYETPKEGKNNHFNDSLIELDRYKVTLINDDNGGKNADD